MERQEPDWSLWRSFAAVVELGSLSAAARRLGASQPTLGRHIDALEQALGVTLFERTLSGFRATETGLRLYEPIHAARQSLAEARLIAEGAQDDLIGTVRITAATMVTSYVLPRILVPIRQAHPSIALELVPTDSVENLLLREADIAVRMFRPTQLDLIARKIGTIPVIACAHRSYLERRGTPKTAAGLAGHDMIGLDRSDLILVAARTLGTGWTRDTFTLRTDSHTAGFELMRAGLGIGFAQKPLVEADPDLVPLLPDLLIPPLEMWLVTHDELYTSRRIRAIYDHLALGLSAYLTA